MAAAAPSPLASSVEKTNRAKLSRLLIDGGTTVLRKAFDRFHPSANLASDLKSHYSTLKKILNKHQWKKLFPPGGAAPDSQSFDITLLFLLLINICDLSPPLLGWHTNPPTSHTSFEANLARIKFLRNVLYGHVSTSAVHTSTFSTLWQEITLPLIALGLDQAEINRLKAENGGEEDYLDALFEWADSEKDIKSQLKNVQASLDRLECWRKKEEKDRDRRERVFCNLAKFEFKGDIENYVQRFQADTREWVFNRIQNWLDDRSSPNRAMVISGNTGMGKSVIAAVICQRMQEAGKLSGNHFCQHNNARYRNPQWMLQSLACQLSHALPEYKQTLVEQLSRNLGTDLNDMAVEELFALLFKEPLSALGDPGSNMLMVIDGLDEREHEGRNELLDVMANQFGKLPSWIRFLVTTRPATNITEKLKHLKQFQLKPEDENNVQDIRTVLENRLQHIFKPQNVETVVQNLVWKSEGLMLYAHFLTLAIEESPSVLDKEDLHDSLPLGISSVCYSYLKRLEGELLRDVNVKEQNFQNLLCAITASREPLPIDFVSELLIPGEQSPLAKRRILKAFATVSSLLPIRDGCLHVINKSVKDWLTDSSCYGEHDFIMEEKQGHRVLARLCTAQLDALKRKGVHNVQYSAADKYALYHGARHMFHVHNETRRDRLEELTKAYVTDLELLYAKLCVNSFTAVEDIIWFQKQGISALLSEDIQSILNTLRHLLREYRWELASHPYLLLQCVLNEGGAVLSGEASNLLQTKYPEIPYMEYIHKESQQGRVVAQFECSSAVLCIDVSPNLDLMAGESENGMLHLWSLQTGTLLWKQPVQVPKSVARYTTYRRFPFLSALSCYRSVVFHPTEDLVLPGILSHAYTIDGDLKPLFVESSCRFSVCSVSGDKSKMLTDCLGDAKCLMMWSLENGAEIARITREEDVLSFAWSHDGTLLAISHSTGSICLLDVMSDFTILTKTTLPMECGMLRFSPENQVLLCVHNYEAGRNVLFRVSVTERRRRFSLVVSYGESPYDPKKFDSLSDCGFLSGDPFFTWYGELYFVRDKHTSLRILNGKGTILMFSTDEIAKNIPYPVTNAAQIALSSDGETVDVVSGGYEESALVARDVSSGKLMTEKSTGITWDTEILSVTEGVLLKTRKGTLELWRFDLSECIQRWTNLSKNMQVLPISDERVACVTSKKVITLDTTSGNILSTFPTPALSSRYYVIRLKRTRLRRFRRSMRLKARILACNSKSQIIAGVDFGTFQLSDGTFVFWEKELPCFYSHPGNAVFSPNEQFVIIFDSRTAFILDVMSGKTLHMLEGSIGESSGCRCIDSNFISDEECVVSDFSSVALYSVKSGALLSVIHLQVFPFCLAVCPSKRLFAIGLEGSSPNYSVIRVWLPGDKDSRKSKRIDNTVETVQRKKPEELENSKSGMDNTEDTVDIQQLKEREQSKKCALM